MKINVEMTAEEFDEFMNYRKGKQVIERDYNALRRKAYKLREEVLNAIQIDEKKGEAALDFKDAQTVVNLAYDL